MYWNSTNFTGTSTYDYDVEENYLFLKKVYVKNIMLFSFYVRSVFLLICVKMHPKSHTVETRCGDEERESVKHVQTNLSLG